MLTLYVNNVDSIVEIRRVLEVYFQMRGLKCLSSLD